ncbi:Clan CA, family C54, ATG4-like cysteine peptidase [Trichomonas vaginalis G3]|uniref:Cysteine protease n=1 Tax=Trichomonas vaginalis (strain ATCC PRA-98 / G3) TaxID=412133 RepID=A2DBW2_TRIV3|nr:protein delipidation [Trichomonas vaginalis G3]EAY22003.1 Clan CA, family C54, ATG4-like cysteine peptidase [Trichomonas vaginalis G3]KAI5525373.1 protein delipidation [Trichomonas vaginalis G3]|eukprot:XP_001582989.1 Clan CA, family C54, ATG4-like cysteine peptidase [Trichomonas vaginalis G3]
MKVISTNGEDREIKDVIADIPRFCYRYNLSDLANSLLTTDKGWGCCFRSTQGLLCQYILKLHRKFRSLYDQVFGQNVNPLDLFLDIPSAPFGIQNLTKNAFAIGLPVGEWAKPSIMAATIKLIFDTLNLSCIISQDLTLDSNDIKHTKYPALILIPSLFGLSKMDDSYLSFLLLCLCIESSLGFVSGQNASAYYFVGFDLEDFYYFDPHVTKEAVVSPPYDSFFDLELKSMKKESINPSVLLGFYCDGSIDDLIMQLTGCIKSPISVIERENLDDILNSVIEIE